MTEEEKEAIKELTEIKELVEEDLKYKDCEVTATLDQIDLESLVVVLNLIKKKDTEINKLNNVIDRMAAVFSKISKGEYVTIEAHTEKDKIIEYFMKE